MTTAATTPPDAADGWKPWLLATGFPIMGVLLANVMSLSPLPTFIALWHSRTLHPIDPMPVVIMFGCAAHTFLYGVTIQNPYLFLSNAPAVVIQGFCMLALFRAELSGTRATLALGFVLASLALLLFNLGLERIWHLPWAIEWLGITFNAYQYAFFLFPLLQLKRVVLTRSAVSLVPPLILAVTVNGALWSLYGIALRDAFIAGPNIAAFVVGAVQLACIAFFGRGEEKGRTAAGRGGEHRQYQYQSVGGQDGDGDGDGDEAPREAV